MQLYSDPWLLALARSGDKEAFSQLMTRYQPMAFRLAIRLVGNKENACELVQEVMLQAYLSLEQLRDTLRFKSWFYGIVLNVCRNFLRTQKHVVSSLDELLIAMPEAELLGFQLDLSEEIDEHELHALMPQAIQQLSPRNQSVTRLYYYGQYSVREIAGQLDISTVAVKSRLQQARKELREYLFRHDPELARSRVIAQRRSISMREVTGSAWPF
jgi:RNA polymerase sigma factor (sigma-70 family)